ncbi:MAG: hypothetical protein N4A61_11225 [Pelagimonas sp.]|jgi:hypothetical protein|nr:hypothetical protein [Pelagimonas sp.]
MLTNDERTLLHVATVIVHGGNIDRFRVNDDGAITGPRIKPFKIDGSSDDDDIALVSLIYIAANLIKLGGVDPVDAVDHLVDLGVRHRFAKNVVNRVVGRRHLFSEVWDVVRRMYTAQPDGTPTAIAGDS